MRIDSRARILTELDLIFDQVALAKRAGCSRERVGQILVELGFPLKRKPCNECAWCLTPIGPGPRLCKPCRRWQAIIIQVCDQCGAFYSEKRAAERTKTAARGYKGKHYCCRSCDQCAKIDRHWWDYERKAAPLLTPIRQRILAYFVARAAFDGQAPSQREIAQFTGTHQNSIWRHLVRLEAEGYLTHEKYHSYRLTQSGATR